MVDLEKLRAAVLAQQFEVDVFPVAQSVLDQYGERDGLRVGAWMVFDSGIVMPPMVMLDYDWGLADIIRRHVAPAVTGDAELRRKIIDQLNDAVMYVGQDNESDGYESFGSAEDIADAVLAVIAGGGES